MPRGVAGQGGHCMVADMVARRLQSKFAPLNYMPLIFVPPNYTPPTYCATYHPAALWIFHFCSLWFSLMLLLIWICQFRNIQVQILATIIVHIFASGPHQFELGNFQTNTNPSRIFVLACTWQWCISLMWVLLNRGGQLNAKSYHSREIQWFDPTKVTAVKPPWSLEFMKPV